MTENLHAIKANLKNGFDPTHPILADLRPDGTLEVMQGNHRLAILIEMGYDEIPVRIWGRK